MSAVTTPEDAIRATLARYSFFCDDGRFDEWAGLFTEDVRFHVMGTTHRGRQAATAFISAAQGPEARGRHALTGSLILVDGATARAWSDYVFFGPDQAVQSVGRYHDELVLEDDGVWRFSLREIVFQRESPQLTPPPPA